MLAVLQSYGTFFNSNDFSKINYRYGAISSAASWSILHEIVSGPLALLIFSLYYNLAIPFSCNWILEMSRISVPIKKIGNQSLSG
jgi:hypothetical protein